MPLWQLAQPRSINSTSPSFCMGERALASPLRKRSNGALGVISVAGRLAGAICDDDEDPVLFTAALAIAENELVLDAIRRQKIIVIERLRETTSIALRKGGNSLTVAKARFLQAWLAHREIGLLVPKCPRSAPVRQIWQLEERRISGSS